MSSTGTPSREWAISARELFIESGQWFWWLIVGVVSGAIGLAGNFAKVSIGSQVWVYVLAAGAVLSTFRAFHRARVSRDRALGQLQRAPISTSHQNELRESLETVRTAVAKNNISQYGDAVGHLRRDSFRAHYPWLPESLDDWDTTVQRRVDAGKGLTTKLQSEADGRGLVQSTFDRDRIVAALSSTTMVRAESGQLDLPFQISWNGFGDNLMPQHDRDPWITLEHLEGESDDDWRTRAHSATALIDELATDAQALPDVADYLAAHRQREELRQPLLDALLLASKRDQLNRAGSCPICEVNQR